MKFGVKLLFGFELDKWIGNLRGIFIYLNSSVGDKNRFGVTAIFLSLLFPSVGRIILVNDKYIHASTTSEDSMGTCSLCFSANHGGW